METLNDAQLLTAAQAGDAAALQQLLLRHQATVYRFGLRMCRNEQDARDVLQETLWTMARGVRDFRGGSSLSTWLFAIARSHCLKHRRRSKFAPSAPHAALDEVAERAELTDPSSSPEEQVASKQLEGALELALRALEPAQREVLVLRDVEGLTAPEVAEVLGVSVAAVKSRLHRARMSVRAQLEAAAPAVRQEGCPDVLGLYSEYVEGDVSAEMCAQMEQHLASCPSCRFACDSLKRTLLRCRTARSEPEVPAAVQDAVRAALASWLGPAER